MPPFTDNAFQKSNSWWKPRLAHSLRSPGTYSDKVLTPSQSDAGLKGDAIPLLGQMTEWTSDKVTTPSSQESDNQISPELSVEIRSVAGNII